MGQRSVAERFLQRRQVAIGHGGIAGLFESRSGFCVVPRLRVNLAQLEQGDIVEAIYDGYSIPGESGAVGLDTPDLLPERTGVHDAKIELRLPDSLQPTMFVHEKRMDTVTGWSPGFCAYQL